jgi:hypothetical protein
VNVLPGSCSGMSVLPCNDECEVTSINTEQDTDIHIKVEEIPEPILFPEIKDEPDEVSYMSECHQYIKMVILLNGLVNLLAPQFSFKF